ncbi:MAG: hypothetical protein HZB68_00615 [Candidatus Aenigmarchaeota archaeon]|nr:hypothetical protein [Candidatus Aenigmarchaeota archaeon]
MNKNLIDLAKLHCDYRVNYVSSNELPVIESSDFSSVYDRKTLVEISRYNDEWERAYMEKV